MAGGRLDRCKTCIQQLFQDHLHDGDTVGLVVFNDNPMREVVQLGRWPEIRADVTIVLGVREGLQCHAFPKDL